MADSTTSIRYLKGVGEQRAAAFEKLGIHTIGELIRYFPRSYDDRTVTLPISEAEPDTSCCIEATVASVPHLSRIRKGMELVKFRAVDDTGAVDITFFNQSYVRTSFHVGDTFSFYGKIGGIGNHKTMTNPDFEPAASVGRKTGLIMPKYRLCRGVSNLAVMNAVHLALGAADTLPKVLPWEIERRYELAQAVFSYNNIHFPSDMHSLELARRRLAFEELFVLSCALEKLGSENRRAVGTVIKSADLAPFYGSLGFEPTGAQKRAVCDCLSDMASGRAMNRLVQGDVGSGKTLVAAACCYAVCRAGYQAAFMAPTEILASQHFDTMRSFLAPFGIRTEKLTGSMAAKEKRRVKESLASGDTDLVIGTHALISSDVRFRSPALIITDEQHRFGVEQRSALGGKGRGLHTLVMSATPIPRTLALIIYGDLDVSVIDEMPPDRQKVDTFAVDSSYRERLCKFIERQVAEGRQVFVVCPKVDDDGDADDDGEPKLKSAEEHARSLASRFPALRVGCIHGKMKPKAKDEIMSLVVQGEIDILVSTTVIEVGVDVPNASLMIIENAERFGLSQLHQLRGRVGRGKHKSYCVLVSDAKSPDVKARLSVMCKTSDGFRISEEDLNMRGPGDFFGSRQHGLPEMHLAGLCSNVSVMREAQEAARATLALDPALSLPEHSALRREIGRLFDLSASTFN